MADAGEPNGTADSPRPPMRPTIRIMRRDPSTSHSLDASAASASASSSASVSSSRRNSVSSTSPQQTGGTSDSVKPSFPFSTATSTAPPSASGKDRRNMTMQEREAAYQAARARIFGSTSQASSTSSASPSPSEPSSLAPSPTNSARPRRRVPRGQLSASSPSFVPPSYGPSDWISSDPSSTLWSPAGPVPVRAPSYAHTDPHHPLGSSSSLDPSLPGAFSQMHVSTLPSQPHPLTDESDPATTTCRSAWTWSMPPTRPATETRWAGSPAMPRPSPQPFDPNTNPASRPCPEHSDRTDRSTRPGRRKEPDASPIWSPTPRQYVPSTGAPPSPATALDDGSFPVLGRGASPAAVGSKGSEVGTPPPGTGTGAGATSTRRPQPSVWSRSPARASLPARPDWVMAALQSQSDNHLNDPKPSSTLGTTSLAPVSLLARADSPTCTVAENPAHEVSTSQAPTKP